MTKTIPAIFCLLLLTSGAHAAAPAAVPPAAAAPSVAAVKTSTPAISVASIYPVEKMRDPFQKGGSSGGPSVAVKEFVLEDFTIHNLSLRGLMKDAGADYALLVDREFGLSFVLRKGRLYDQKNKPLPGITGKIDIRAKQVSIVTADKDVQVLRLGEEEPAE